MVSKKSFQCPYCETKYAKESTVLSHKCLKRDRYNIKDQRASREAFSLFLQFYSLNNIKFKRGCEPIMAFIGSSFYGDFIRFAKYIIETDILDKEAFIRHCMLSKEPIGNWSASKMYKDWIKNTIRTEEITKAVTRSIEAMVEWGIQTGNDWNTFFEKCSTDRAIFWFETGRISPWILYVIERDSGNKLLLRMSGNELDYLLTIMDPTFFNILKVRHEKEVTELKKLLSSYNL